MPRIGILIVAYNAESTLAATLDRIPQSFRSRIERILVADDHSVDATYERGLQYQAGGTDLPLTVIRQPRNLGYGGNQKAGYRWAVANDLDIVVLLHGDGQYAPELLPEMVAPLVEGRADAVFGSRMLEPRAALAGGMPLYKYVGNRILTTAQNRLMGADLSEWHSGYRAYRVAALAEIPFELNDDGFNFDTQIIIQLLEAEKRIVEIPIPTFYGDEICYVNGMKYARDVMRDVIRYRLHRIGFGSGEATFANEDEESYGRLDPSRGLIVGWLRDRETSRILDLSCGDGSLAAELAKLGHHVTGIERRALPGVAGRVDDLVIAPLEAGIPAEVGDGFDVVIAAEALEQVPDPDALMRQIVDILSPDGVLLASIPNFAHWYPRLRVGSGRFDYERRGILDRRHLRFFTRRSFLRQAGRCGFVPVWEASTGLPLDALGRGSPGSVGRPVSPLRKLLAGVDRAGKRVSPTLFSYQYLFALSPDPARPGA